MMRELSFLLQSVQPPNKSNSVLVKILTGYIVLFYGLLSLTGTNFVPEAWCF